MYEIFKQLLEERSITPYRVSKETGIPQATLSDWKNGKSVPKLDKLQAIADYLGVELNYLLTGRKPTRTPDIPEAFVVMARKTDKLTEQQQEKLFALLNKTIDEVISFMDTEG